MRRDKLLSERGGVEDTVTLTIGDQIITAVPESDVERTDASGKTSSVHFFHFPFTDHQVAMFKDPSNDVVLGFGHENYAHMAGLPGPVRAALAADFA